jgi:hypothetical protein
MEQRNGAKMKSMKRPPAQEWDTEEAAHLARQAYRYVARTYPRDADLEPIGKVDRVVLEAQERGDWPRYVEALRELMRTAKREAMRRAA